MAAAQPIILITNNDGIDAAGLHALVQAIVSTNRYRVFVFAPNSEKSGVSHSFTWRPAFVTPCRRSLIIKAAMEPSPIIPLKIESPTGQFLSQVLINHPHLLPAAVDHQLQADRHTKKSKGKDEPAPPATDLVLYRRITEMKGGTDPTLPAPIARHLAAIVASHPHSIADHPDLVDLAVSKLHLRACSPNKPLRRANTVSLA